MNRRHLSKLVQQNTKKTLVEHKQLFGVGLLIETVVFSNHGLFSKRIIYYSDMLSDVGIILSMNEKEFSNILD